MMTSIHPAFGALHLYKMTGKNTKKIARVVIDPEPDASNNRHAGKIVYHTASNRPGGGTEKEIPDERYLIVELIEGVFKRAGSGPVTDRQRTLLHAILSDEALADNPVSRFLQSKRISVPGFLNQLASDLPVEIAPNHFHAGARSGQPRSYRLPQKPPEA